MNLMQLLKDIGQTAKKQIDWINSGGCCVYASLIAQQLDQLNVPCSIAVSSDYCENRNLDDARENLEENSPLGWNSVGVDFAHVVVEFEFDGKLYFYDTNGIIPSGKYLKPIDEYRAVLDGRLSIDEAVELAANPVGWNTLFNRKLIPKLEYIINSAFEAYRTQIGQSS